MPEQPLSAHTGRNATNLTREYDFRTLGDEYIKRSVSILTLQSTRYISLPISSVYIISITLCTIGQ